MLAPFLSLLLGPLHTEVAAPAIPWNAIAVVRCGPRMGTAFHIGGGRYMTAAHVVEGGDCSEPFKAVTRDDGLDAAELTGPADKPAFKVDCHGFRVNRHYLAIGHAGGIMRLELPLIYSAFGRHPTEKNGMFVGPDIHPGMSGGPLITEDYKVAGIVTHRWPARSRALADTWICRSA